VLFWVCVASDPHPPRKSVPNNTPDSNTDNSLFFIKNLLFYALCFFPFMKQHFLHKKIVAYFIFFINSHKTQIFFPTSCNINQFLQETVRNVALLDFIILLQHRW
jgi:hypothetical protein